MSNLTREAAAKGHAAATERQAQRVAAGLSATRNPLEAFIDNPTSRQKAIAAKCWDCHGAEGADSGWKWAVGNCQIPACPLHTFRPYQRMVGSPPQGAYKC